MKMFYFIILITINESFQIKKFKIPAAFLIQSLKETTKYYQKEISHPTSIRLLSLQKISYFSDSSLKVTTSDSTLKVTTDSNFTPASILKVTTSDSSMKVNYSSYMPINEFSNKAASYKKILIIAFIITALIVFSAIFFYFKIKKNIQKRFMKNSSEIQLNELNRQLRNEENEMSKQKNIEGNDNEIFMVENSLTRSDSHMTVIDLN
jgi:hypothetical protein